jgi:hypothetical protein
MAAPLGHLHAVHRGEEQRQGTGMQHRDTAGSQCCEQRGGLGVEYMQAGSAAEWPQQIDGALKHGGTRRAHGAAKERS